MAEFKGGSVGTQARRLANLWGQAFGNTDYGRTLGEMKTLLNGNQKKGLPSYRQDHIAGCIQWLADAQKEKRLKNDIQGPGVIRWVIRTFIDGGGIEDTFLGYEEPKRVVRML